LDHAPTSALKRRNETPKRGERKTLGGAGRKRTQTDSNDDNRPLVTPYKWSTNKTKEKQTRSGPKTISTRASAVANDTDDSADTTDSEEEEEDSVEVVGTGTVARNTSGNLTTQATGNELQINTEDTIDTLQESVA
jgi:hypothetical protein